MYACRLPAGVLTSGAFASLHKTADGTQRVSTSHLADLAIDAQVGPVAAAGRQCPPVEQRAASLDASKLGALSDSTRCHYRQASAAAGHGCRQL